MHVDRSKCIGCKKCVDACPTSAIRIIKKKAYILRTKCNDCSLCIRICPQGAIRPFSSNLHHKSKRDPGPFTPKKRLLKI